MKINILGSEWDIEFRTPEEDFRLNSCDGFTDWTSKLIVVAADPETDLDNPKKMAKKILRHEIVHVFLFESGLSECAYDTSGGWANNEEMVDWFARQGLKIYRAWEEADALD